MNSLELQTAILYQVSTSRGSSLVQDTPGLLLEVLMEQEWRCLRHMPDSSFPTRPLQIEVSSSEKQNREQASDMGTFWDISSTISWNWGVIENLQGLMIEKEAAWIPSG